MSITSVGASFGYVDPNSVGGTGQAPPAAPDDNDSPAPASASNKSDDGTNPNPTPPQPQATSSGGPKFAPDTGAALVQVQEKANAA